MTLNFNLPRIPRLHPMVLSINADVAVPTFFSTNLICKYTSPEQLTGFASFRGKIGAGKIDIVLDNGLQISGPIEGRPSQARDFVGAGPWLMG